MASRPLMKRWNMYLDEIVAAQKRGQARGIPSVCSAHPHILGQTLKAFKFPLIEATCNQVNQFGGYTGMTPGDFVAYVRGIAGGINFPFENILFGGDHMGPNVWQNEPAGSAMDKSREMVRAYVQAGFVKLHLDCSMRLADDPPGLLDQETMAGRVAQLAKIAEESGSDRLRYVIGSEVPVPGGALEHEEAVSVTRVEDARQAIEATREAFTREGLHSAWERVIALVVQPGVEFGDDFVLGYRPEQARQLSQFIEGQSLVYEAHSTDYQSRDALHNLVKDHFAILKVGPGLTFAFREAVFALAMIENELVGKDRRSNLMQVLDDAMVRHPVHWEKYYRGGPDEKAYKRKYSLSDRMRYYWVRPEVRAALEQLMRNLGPGTLPYPLLSQFVGKTDLTAAQVIEWKIRKVFDDYLAACRGPAG
jgi:D-tagatose-1,6-bisphosphate aldolase subunit GatZ/KbaZ